MLSRLFGKRDKSADSPTKEAQDSRGPAGKEEDRESTWSTWDKMQMPKDVPKDVTPMDSTYTGLAPLPGAKLPPKPVIRTSSMAPLSTTGLSSTVTRAAEFPADHQIDFELPTAPMDLVPELTLEERKAVALETVTQYHPRIGNTIRTLWGYKECAVYINRLIMAGGDGMGQARVGFNQEAVAAMLALSDIHDAEFGPPSTLGGGLSLAP